MVSRQARLYGSRGTDQSYLRLGFQHGLSIAILYVDGAGISHRLKNSPFRVALSKKNRAFARVYSDAGFQGAQAEGPVGALRCGARCSEWPGTFHAFRSSSFSTDFLLDGIKPY